MKVWGVVRMWSIRQLKSEGVGCCEGVVNRTAQECRVTVINWRECLDDVTGQSINQSQTDAISSAGGHPYIST